VSRISIVATAVPREEASAAWLSAAIDAVLDDGEMRATSASHSERLQATDPPARAVDLIEQLL